MNPFLRYVQLYEPVSPLNISEKEMHAAQESMKYVFGSFFHKDE